ncbi:MAG: hypothetical protein JNM93_12730, partial [Bacteriovoracaceae bacterium]|nr:hypothetical protein [Bacteriovoracaceae bacterium]
MKEMRLNFIIVLLTIFIAFVAGYYALFIQDRYTVTEEDVTQIREIKRKFNENYSPLLIINFNNIYRTVDSFELLRPVVSIKKSNGFMGHANIYSTDSECFTDMKMWPNSIRGEKAILWEEFRCGHRRVLPSNFFSAPPYLHPSGMSFAFHAFKLSKYPYNNTQWAEKELAYFHISELKQVKASFDRFPAVFEFLSRLDADALLSILKGRG